MRVYLQFPAGTAPLVESSLRHALPDARLTYRDDSAAILQTSKLPELAFARNVFEILAATPRRSLPRSVNRLTSALYADRPGSHRPAGRGFRVMFHLDGSLTAVDDRVRTRLEAAIAECTGARVRARGSCDEYWVVGRRALDQLLLCHRLDRRRITRPVRGALSPELSALLVAASRPTADDVFLDPFGGTGALVAARLTSPARTILYSDLRKPSQLQRAVADDRRVRILTEDATELPSIPTGSVTAIVTDPPWGEHETLVDSYRQFATRTCASFDRVLDPHRGRLVLLTSRRTEPLFRRALGGTKVDVGDTHRILVNGHPASVLLADAGGLSGAAVDD